MKVELPVQLSPLQITQLLLLRSCWLTCETIVSVRPAFAPSCRRFDLAWLTTLTSFYFVLKSPWRECSICNFNPSLYITNVCHFFSAWLTTFFCLFIFCCFLGLESVKSGFLIYIFFNFSIITKLQFAVDFLERYFLFSLEISFYG